MTSMLSHTAPGDTFTLAASVVDRTKNLAHGLATMMNGATRTESSFESPPPPPRPPSPPPHSPSPVGQSPSGGADGSMAEPSVKLAQPPDLNKVARQKLRVWLDEQAPTPFRVHYSKPSKKRKRSTASTSHVQVQTFDLDERLNVEFEVIPAAKWSQLRKYRVFTLNSNESLTIGDCIYVKHQEDESSDLDVAAQWKAIVHEVRALDPEHVYIRVSWLNRPEDLESGRKAYHGEYELIPTNRMDIIDAAAVNGGFELSHWRDADDDGGAPNAGEFYWRQTYDFVKERTLSELPLICTDNTPHNPDEAIVQCMNADCRKWMHGGCIAKAAVKKSVDKKKRQDGAVTTVVMAEGNSSALATAKSHSHVAELFVKGYPEGTDTGTEPAPKTEIVITDSDRNKRSKEVRCLFCKSTID